MTSSSTRRQAKPRNKQQTRSGLDLDQCIGPKPGDDDVVLGRGGESNHHSGTKRFRDMVDSRKQKFAKAKTNREKADIVMGCLACLKAQGGRIVGRWEGVYYEATEKRQYAKVIQRLRERKKRRQPPVTKKLEKKEPRDVSDDDATATDDDTSNATISSGTESTQRLPAAKDTSNSIILTDLEFMSDDAVPKWPLPSFIPMMDVDVVDDLNVLDDEIDELLVGGCLFEEVVW